MKKLWIIPALFLLLAGCGAQETFETISDVYKPEQPSAQQVVLTLPEEAALATVITGETGKLYLCDGYVLTVQTFAGGDLNSTLLQLTGFPRDSLQPVETVQGSTKRYDCVWTAAGEGEDQVGRATILDDGSYHYAVTVMAGASRMRELNDIWQDILSSVSLRTG